MGVNLPARGGRTGKRSLRNAEGASWLDRQVSPSFLFLWGLVLAPALVLQELLWLKALQAALLVALAVGTGRIRSRGVLLGSAVFLVATVLINLLAPLGRLIARVGPLRVTDGALSTGLSKALTLLALTYLSRLCVRGDLALPGAAGRYLRLTFGYLNALLARRGGMAGRDLIGRIDGVLAAVLSGEEAAAASESRSGRTRPAGVAVAAALAGLLWLPLFWRI